MLKGCLIVGAVGIVLVAVFGGVLWFLTSSSEDQSYLTAEYSGTVIESESTGQSREYRVVYEYSADGQTYYGESKLIADRMYKGYTVTICADPDDVRRHATAYYDCGESDLASSTRDGLSEKPSLG